MRGAATNASCSPQIATNAKRGESAAAAKAIRILIAQRHYCNDRRTQRSAWYRRRIAEKEGYYILALKTDQRALHADVSRLFEDSSHETTDEFLTLDGDHGPIETRTALVSIEIKRLQES